MCHPPYSTMMLGSAGNEWSLKLNLDQDSADCFAQGYCRGVRVGNQFVIAGTTTRAHMSGKGVIGGASAEDQTTNVMDIIAGAVNALGASMADVTRTRILLSKLDEWQGVAKVHGRTFGRHGILPVNTMVGGTSLIGEGILVEVEAEGVVDSSKGPRLRL